ncbi:zinc finger protein 37 [Plutella xylostella]|uniref:zinc finger protein 37 n=1 Tax=Plutella xylostella TaxID=51655 RepID=UPI00203303FA|nr:zinc finger protein 37 [Plutella xylostella]
MAMTFLQTSNCLVCNLFIVVQPPSNGDDPLGVKNSIDVFSKDSIVPSGQQLLVTLQEVVCRKINKTDSKSTLICRKCYKTCCEYDNLQKRLRDIKSEMAMQYSSRKISNTVSQVSKKSEGQGQAKVVVAASKLKPLPANYVILNRGSLGKPVSQSIQLKLPNTTNTVLIPAATTPVATHPMNTLKNTHPKPKITINSPLLLSPVKKTTSLVDEIAEISEVTNGGFSMPIINSENSAGDELNDLAELVLKKGDGGDKADEDDAENNDELPMEIDEDCTNSAAKEKSGTDYNSVFAEHIKKNNIQNKSADMQVINIQRESDSRSNSENENENDENENENEQEVEVEILEEDVDEDTIVMSDSNGSFLRVVMGQELYGDDEIFIVPQNGEQNDSNDESQIELQVSGDEETANAIIAAAKEQGGAFIKVQSGEMFRVKSVQSKVEDDPLVERPLSTIELVERDGSLYKCVLCENAKKNKDENDDTTEDNSSSQDSNPGFSTKKPDSIVEHMKQIHNSRVYVCADCGIVIRKRAEYNKHIATHSGASQPQKKQHECDICHKRCGSRNLLIEHMNYHKGNKPYCCEECGKRFSSKYTYQAHLKTHMDRPRPFKCKQCSKAFFTQQNLAQHEKTHWGVKDFICKVCGKAFGTQHNLEVHGVVHSGLKPFACGVCGKAFARKAEIRDHIRTHTGERPFACNICGATFSQRSNLTSHARATHTGDKRHKCETCGKTFKRRRLLDYHTKAAHTGERPYQCEVCRATFVYPEHYKKHIRIHTGEKPYVCEVCGKSFNTRDNRNAHRFVHSDKKPYECLVCAQGFMRKPLLLAHMNASGHMTESIVVNQPRVSQEENDSFRIPALEENPLELENEDSQNEDISKVFIQGENKIIVQGAPESDDSTLLSLAQNLVEGSGKIDASILESITTADLEKGTQIVANDENGATVRLVQIQLADGGTGWIAIN